MPARAIVLMLCLTGCASGNMGLMERPAASPMASTLVDPARSRPVPVLLYGRPPLGRRKPLAIISHGYGGHNGAYSFLANDLVARGYLVVSIEHVDGATAGQKTAMLKAVAACLNDARGTARP